MTIDSSVLTYSGETRTGAAFHGAIIACATAKGVLYRFLFDAAGEPLKDRERVRELSNFFGMEFKPAKVDDLTLYANIEK